MTAAALANFARTPVAGVPTFNPKGGLTFLGANGDQISHTRPVYLSPRFGVAWTPGGKGTVLRAGVGVFVASIGTQGVNQPGFSASSTVLGAATTSNLRPAVTLDTTMNLSRDAFGNRLEQVAETQRYALSAS